MNNEFLEWLKHQNIDLIEKRNKDIRIQVLLNMIQTQKNNSLTVPSDTLNQIYNNIILIYNSLFKKLKEATDDNKTETPQ